MPVGDGASGVILAGLAALFLFTFGGDDEAGKQPPRGGGRGTITVHQQIIVRVSPGALPAGAGASQMVRWEEHRGPRCIAARQILGAARLGQNSVDLVFRDRTRVRARLEGRCPALDFYSGFYLPVSADGQICADRDSVRSRTGGECQIEQFRTLTAAPR
jgi:hypothetical protein